jgi:hypothetical protein
LQETVKLAEVGFVPAVIVPLKAEVSPAVAAVAVPLADGFVEAGAPFALAVKLKSSTASPSSEPVESKSVQRIQKVLPFAMDNPEIVCGPTVALAGGFTTPTAAAWGPE